jgi:predicted DNA-binding transcriptional regulator AlpA
VDELRSVDVADYLDVSRQRVSQLASEQGFPSPRHRPDGTRVWRADEILRWAERNWWGLKPWRERPRGAMASLDGSHVLTIQGEEAPARNS